MLKIVKKESLDDLMRDIIPEDVLDADSLNYKDYVINEEGVSE